jgi:hypothetical protein
VLDQELVRQISLSLFLKYVPSITLPYLQLSRFNYQKININAQLSFGYLFNSKFIVFRLMNAFIKKNVIPIVIALAVVLTGVALVYLWKLS